MVEADAERTITFCEAIELASRALGSLGERLLGKGLARERVRWTCQLVEGDPTGWNLPTSKPGVSGKFWQHNPEVHSAENWARTRFLSGPTVCTIAVMEADVLALLPTAEQPAPLQAEPKRKSQQVVARVVREALWPGGLPETMSTPEAVQKLGNEMQRRGMKVPSDDTLKRALDRR